MSTKYFPRRTIFSLCPLHYGIMIVTGSGGNRIVRFDNCATAVHFAFKGFSRGDDAHWWQLLLLVELEVDLAPKCTFCTIFFLTIPANLLWSEISDKFGLKILWCSLILLVFSIFIVECGELWRLSIRGSGIILFLFTSFQNPVQLNRKKLYSKFELRPKLIFVTTATTSHFYHRPDQTVW